MSVLRHAACRVLRENILKQNKHTPSQNTSKQTSKACKTNRGKAKQSEAAAFPTKTQRKQIVKDRFALLRDLGMKRAP